MHLRNIERAEDERFFEPLNFFLRFNRPQRAKRKHINKARRDLFQSVPNKGKRRALSAV